MSEKTEAAKDLEDKSVGLIEKKLHQMLLKLPLLAAPIASYLPIVSTGKLIYVSGQLPLVDNALRTYKGRLGKEINLETGQRAAQHCTLNALAHIKDQFKSLEKIKRVVKLTGYVAGMPGFTDQAKVLNGASDLLVELFGDNGKHARAAVGVTDLPMGACVEIEFIFEMK